MYNTKTGFKAQNTNAEKPVRKRFFVYNTESGFIENPVSAPPLAVPAREERDREVVLLESRNNRQQIGELSLPFLKRTWAIST